MKTIPQNSGGQLQFQLLLFSIFILLLTDVTAPSIISCPDKIVQYADRNSNSKKISWTEPQATDNSAVTPDVLQVVGKSPGDIFLEGDYRVRYIFTDGSGNTAQCSFQVSVSGK